MGLGDPSKGMNKWAVPETEAREIIRYALSQGINFFDTAMSYQEGNSEEVLGRALRDFAKRKDYIVATKFLPRSEDEINHRVSGQKHIADCLDKNSESPRFGMRRPLYINKDGIDVTEEVYQAYEWLREHTF